MAKKSFASVVKDGTVNALEDMLSQSSPKAKAKAAAKLQELEDQASVSSAMVTRFQASTEDIVAQTLDRITDVKQKADYRKTIAIKARSDQYRMVKASLRSSGKEPTHAEILAAMKDWEA